MDVNDRIRYGIVGLGRAGWSIHRAQLAERPDAEIIAVADSEADRRAEAETVIGCRAYDGIDPLLEDDRIDVIVVATPTDHHLSETLAALQAGKHVVVEKPMALNTADADRMIAAARLNHRHLFVHHQHRFSPLFRHLESVVASGLLGRIFLIRNHVAIFHRRNDWQALVRHGGGELNNSGAHYIDLVLQLLGSPVVEVMADLQRVVTAGDADDHVKVMMRARSGCIADVEISRAEALAMPVPMWTICGDCGTLTSDGCTSHVHWFDPKDAPPLLVDDGPAANRAYGNDDALPWHKDVHTIDCRSDDGFYDNVHGVIQRSEPVRVTPESIREVVRVVELIRRSAGHQAASVPSAPPAAVTV